MRKEIWLKNQQKQNKIHENSKNECTVSLNIEIGKGSAKKMDEFAYFVGSITRDGGNRQKQINASQKNVFVEDNLLS